MLYMTILTWEPPQRDAVIKRFATLGVKEPAGVKVLGMWVDINGGRAFELEEWPATADPKLSVQASFAWNDLCKIEPVPVIEAQEMMKLLPKA
jgi:hypothetical protein